MLHKLLGLLPFKELLAVIEKCIDLAFLIVEKLPESQREIAVQLIIEKLLFSGDK